MYNSNFNLSEQGHLFSIGLPFVPFNGQNNLGDFLVGVNENWCSDINHYAFKIRLLQNKFYLACAESSILNAAYWHGNGFAPLLLPNNKGFSYKISKNSEIIPYNITLPIRDSVFVGDFNGDNIDELGISYPEGYYILSLHDNAWHFSQSSLENWCISTRNKYSIQESGIRVGDFNGDKKDDLLCHDKDTGNIQLRLSQPTNSGTNITWSTPHASFSRITWCKKGEIYVGDFNGDKKDDLFCVKETGLSMLFSLDDGNFAHNYAFKTPSQIFYPPIINKIMDENFFVKRFVLEDFNGDGFVDILYSDPDGNNYFLFSNGLYFESKTFHRNGYSMLNNGIIPQWCSSILINNSNYYPQILAGDFDGDKDSDILCLVKLQQQNATLKFYNANTTTFYLESQFENIFSAYNVKIVISNFETSRFSSDSKHIQEFKHTCDNRVFSNEILECESKIPNILAIKHISLNESFNSSYFSQIPYTIQFKGTLKYFPNKDESTDHSISYIDYIDAYMTDIKSTPFITDHALSQDEITGSVSVRGGECTTMNLKLHYKPDVSIAYNATAQVKVYYKQEMLTSNALLNFAKNLVPTAELNPLDPTELSFPVSGEISTNLIENYAIYTETCN